MDGTGMVREKWYSDEMAGDFVRNDQHLAQEMKSCPASQPRRAQASSSGPRRQIKAQCAGTSNQ
jgi:hypothetical protein